MSDSWYENMISSSSNCDFCENETATYCSKCNRAICDVHTRSASEKGQLNQYKKTYCPKCYNELEKEERWWLKRVFLISAFVVMIIVVGALLYRQLFT
ncbi:MAG: hypothetical protein EAX90_00530 [Candidatus Heimdallarchaeota archaeon]|nr:hypothetical protein [Candidatus Heimdallarchaeota archaeon]